MLNRRVSHLAFLQFEIVQGDIAGNLACLKGELARLSPPQGSLVALPEMWATGFVYEKLAPLSDEIPGLLQELEALAGSYRIILAGSLPWREQDGDESVLYNKLFFSGNNAPVPQGIAKQHLFSFWKEDLWLQSGRRPVPVSLSPDELVGGLVCYDLRFPEAAQLQCRQGAEILLVSAQWPLARTEQWKILLQARAIENQVFVLAANACGRWDDLQMGGHSMIIGPDGEILAEAEEGRGARVVEINREVQKELRERFNTVAPDPWSGDGSEKILSLDELVQIVDRRKKTGQQIVFTNGCFDILHAGHVDYLQKARKQGDFLVLGLNSDLSIRSIKGPQRPVNDESERAMVLAALGCVDAIVLFAEDTPINLITSLCPDVLVKGADWEESEIVGAAEVKDAGGRVERIPFISPTSTSAVIERIRSGS